MYEVDLFQNVARRKLFKISTLLIHIRSLSMHKKNDCFKKKISEIKRDVERQAVEIHRLIKDKKIRLDKGLSPKRIKEFMQFEADEYHKGDQCQVCLEDVEVGRLMKQLDCRGRHSFCSGCIDQWFAEHKTCPICRHNFM